MTQILRTSKFGSRLECSSRLNVWVSARDPAWRSIAQDEQARKTEAGPVEWTSGRLVAIKDNICTTEEPTTCASGMLRGFYSPFAATIVEKLEAAGMVVAGKTNLDEFGMGSDSTHSIHGPVQNWYMRDGEPTSAGGSSGGSAVVVATGQCHEALGTDTGGSVRLPAAYTGIVGFKPSYGLMSRWGVIPYANSLDTVGILGQSTESVTSLYNIIKGHDARDPTSIQHVPWDRNKQDFPKRHTSDQPPAQRDSPLRVGVPAEYNTKELEPIVRQAWMDTLKALQREGHSIHPISLPATKLALSAYYIIAPAEASSNLARYDGMRYGSCSDRTEHRRDGNSLYSGIRGADLGKEVKRRILLGAYSLSAGAIENYFIKAQKVRRLVQQDFNRVFDLWNPLLRDDQQSRSGDVGKIDVIVAPTAQSTAPKLKDVVDRDPVEAYSADVLTIPSSLAGLPAISVPVSVVNPKEPHGPIGMQVIGQYADERTVIAAATAIEKLTKCKNKI